MKTDYVREFDVVLLHFIGVVATRTGAQSALNRLNVELRAHCLAHRFLADQLLMVVRASTWHIELGVFCLYLRTHSAQYNTH